MSFKNSLSRYCAGLKMLNKPWRRYISKYFKLKLHVGAFKLYDTNRDGAITKEEMLNMIKSMVSMMGNKIEHDDLTAEKRVENIFSHMDKASLLNIP